MIQNILLQLMGLSSLIEDNLSITMPESNKKHYHSIDGKFRKSPRKGKTTTRLTKKERKAKRERRKMSR